MRRREGEEKARQGKGEGVQRSGRKRKGPGWRGTGRVLVAGMPEGPMGDQVLPRGGLGTGHLDAKSAATSVSWVRHCVGNNGRNAAPPT